MMTSDEIRAKREGWLKGTLESSRTLVPALCDTALTAIAERDAAMACLMEVRAAFEAVTPLGGRSYVSTHAAHNLDGAIISIEHDGNTVSHATMRTLKRVAEQLATIDTLLKSSLERESASTDTQNSIPPAERSEAP